MKREINGDIYEFDEAEHQHKLNGNPLLGVTTALKTISPVSFDEDGNVSSKTEMLMSWAVKMDIQAFADRAIEYVGAKTAKEREEIIKQVKRTHRQARDKAGSHGNDVHGLLERILKGEKPEVPADIKTQIDFAINSLKGYKIISIEGHVWSRTNGYGGIFDLLLEKDGRFFVADFKTSKGVHNEFFSQCSAYDMAIQEMYPGKYPICGYIIIHIPASGKCSVITNEERGIMTDEAKDVFGAALTIYRLTCKWAQNMK